MRFAILSVLALGLAGCGGVRYDAASSPVAVAPSAMQQDPADTYLIGATDKLSITVFQVPSLTFEEIVVDAAGRLQFPLLGSIKAAGLTPDALTEEIRAGLAARFIRDPIVSVSVSEATSQKITVDGAVNEAGVFEMRGRTTLLQAVAMAKGASRTASLSNVAVFRTVDGRRMAAVYDVAAIRAGRMEDPLLQRDDVVIVDTSRLSENLQLAIQALPAFGVFGYLAN